MSFSDRFQNSEEWIKISEEGITWYTRNDTNIIDIPEIDMYCHKNGKDIILYDNEIDTAFKGTIRERFVGPNDDENFKDMEDWFDEFSAPFTIAVGIKEKIPDFYRLAENWYVIKLQDADEKDRWRVYTEFM